MIRLTKNLCVAAAALAFMMITSCGGGGDAGADKVAAAYYEEQFNNEDNIFGQQSYGDLEKWETMEESRKKSVEGRIMTMIMGFFHKEKPDAPVGKYFVMQNLGDGWTVRTMENGAFLTKEKRDEIMSNVRPAEKAEPQFGPQEQAALEAWKEQFAGRRDFLGHEVTDPAVVAKSAEGYLEKYGEYIDCFVDSGSEKWMNEDGGQIRLIVFHEKKSNQFSVRIHRQDDGSWAAD